MFPIKPIRYEPPQTDSKDRRRGFGEADGGAGDEEDQWWEDSLSYVSVFVQHVCYSAHCNV